MGGRGAYDNHRQFAGRLLRLQAVSQLRYWIFRHSCQPTSFDSPGPNSLHLQPFNGIEQPAVMRPSITLGRTRYVPEAVKPSEYFLRTRLANNTTTLSPPT